VPANEDALAQELLEDSQRVIEEAAHRISAAGVSIECAAVLGRPASAIVDEANEWHPDLIVMGSRGHGEIASMLLGSVSSEVVDHAPCPTFIARQSKLTRAVLGHDGSDCALRAESVFASWPIFARVAIEVVDVGPAGMPWMATTQSTYAGSVEPHVGAVRAAVDLDRNVAESAARRLRTAGLRASASVEQGAPATELIRVANERAADLIVVGTRGRTGLRRLLLGSVARNVLHHASCSVLIVR
jgi:nucleotide-binding universal stress UspA family protein